MTPTPPTYPARPVNGGPLPQAMKFKRPGDWFHEPKINGWRAWLHVPTGAMFNRRNERLSIESEFVKAIKRIQQFRIIESGDAIAEKFGQRPVGSSPPIEWLDCEAFERRHPLGKGCLIILDALTRDRWMVRKCLLENSPVPILGRYHEGTGMSDNGWQGCPENEMEEGGVYYLPYLTDASTDQWRLLNYWEHLQARNKELGCEFYEGIVSKRVDSNSEYPMQLRSPDEECKAWVKHRWAF